MQESGKIANLSYQVFVNVVGYPQDQEWVAWAIEMDLRVSGETFEKAYGELLHQVEVYLSASLSGAAVESVWKSATKVAMEAPILVSEQRLIEVSKRPGEEAMSVKGFPPPELNEDRAARQPA